MTHLLPTPPARSCLALIGALSLGAFGTGCDPGSPPTPETHADHDHDHADDGSGEAVHADHDDTVSEHVEPDHADHAHEAEEPAPPAPPAPAPPPAPVPDDDPADAAPAQGLGGLSLDGVQDRAAAGVETLKDQAVALTQSAAVEQAQARLDEVRKQMITLQAKAQDKGEAALERFNTARAEFEEHYTAASEQLQTLKGAGASAWQDARDEFDKLAAELRGVYEQAVEQVGLESQP